MKAILCKSFGPPENLVLEEVEDLKPGEGEALVEVYAAALNFPDTLLIEGNTSGSILSHSHQVRRQEGLLKN